MAGEYCGGLGDALYPGHQPGQVHDRAARWTWEKTLIRATVEDGEGALNDATMAALAGMAKKLERAFGGPQDIEWARWEGPPVVRAIAADYGRTFVRGAALVDRWSNANVNENFPAPISPLLYSIGRLATITTFGI